jgi:hypothetical protein
VRGYEPWAGELVGRRVGATVSTEQGKATPYAIFNIQERAMMFVTSGVPVYEGQIVGENRREKDMNVNVTRAKKLTNIRAAGKDEAAVLSPPREVQIEWALEWMADDELLEVTPSKRSRSNGPSSGWRTTNSSRSLRRTSACESASCPPIFANVARAEDERTPFIPAVSLLHVSFRVLLQTSPPVSAPSLTRFRIK